MAFRLLQTIATKLEISTAGTPTSKRRRASWDVNISNSQQLEGFCSEFGTKSLFFASDDEWNFWQQIPAQVDVAVRKVFHWERTDVMSTEEFRERVAKRTLHNFTTDARKKMAAGISFADWKAQIKNLEAWLTKVARRASIDEARKVLRLRATKEPQVVVAGFTGFIASVELQESWSRVASAVRELLPAHISDDAGEPMLQFLRGELQTRDRWEHFQVCEDCQLALRIIYDQLIDFVLGASSRAISMRHVSVIKKLRLRTGAIQFLLRCQARADSDEWGKRHEIAWTTTSVHWVTKDHCNTQTGSVRAPDPISG